MTIKLYHDAGFVFARDPAQCGMPDCSGRLTYLSHAKGRCRECDEYTWSPAECNFFPHHRFVIERE